MKKQFFSIIGAAIVLASCNGNSSSKDSVEKADSANTQKMDSSQAAQPAIKTDEASTNFLVKAANGGMAEVKLAELAKEKSANNSIKDFASMMITDHGAANDKVKALAAERNVTIPGQPDNEEQKKYDDLNKKTGADFDKAYVDAMVKGHSSTLDMFQNAKDKVGDSSVKTFIGSTIPVIQHHLETIKGIKKAMK